MGRLHRRRQRRGGRAGQPRILGLHGRIERARPLRIDAFRDELAKDDVAVRKVEASARAPRSGPVDESRTLSRHDHDAGVKVAITQPVPRRGTLEQGKDARG
jgi:hypothetical protein